MIVSMINLKGGVGKTTTAVGLATMAVRDGLETELYDCDPQSSASLWSMSAEEDGDPLPFPTVSANVATVRQASKKLKGNPEKWVFIDCPPNGHIMDEAMVAADFVVVPTGTGAADLAKTFETAGTLEKRGVPYGVLLTQVMANTLSYAQSLSELKQLDLSYFDCSIRRREALKGFFGSNSFGSEMYGYDELWEELKASIAETGCEEDDD